MENDVTLFNPEDISLTPESIIEFTQKQTLDFVLRTRMSGNEKLELQALNNLAKTALASKRLTMDNDNALADRQVAASLNTALMNITQNPFLLPIATTTQIPSIIAPDVPEVTPVFEETSRILANIEKSDIL